MREYSYFGIIYFLFDFFVWFDISKNIDKKKEAKFFIKNIELLAENFELPELRRFNFSFTIPLIIINSHYTDALFFCVTQVHKILPQLPVFVIIDEYCDKLPSYVNQYLANKNSANIKLFNKYYIHRSINNVFYEKYCILRWFYLTDFLSKHKEYNFFLTFDSDTLIYIDFFKLPIFVSSLKPCDAITILNVGGVFSILCSEYMVKFCQFILLFYRNILPFVNFKNNLTELKSFYSKHYRFPIVHIGQFHFTEHISDMTLFSMYNMLLRKNYSICSNNFFGQYVINNHLRSGPFFTLPNSHYINITFKNNMPTAKHMETNKTIVFISLHFQNGDKAIMNRFLI